MLMIGKDRRRIYDRFIGEQFISEPDFYVEYISRESKRPYEDLYLKYDI